MPLEALRKRLLEGLVIPAHPLALTAERRLDERRQSALTRYYLDAGAGGLAVGVHTTQFEIHDPRHGLYQPVLALAAETARQTSSNPPVVMVAGLVGKTAEALAEAAVARELGYHCGLLSLGAMADADDRELIEHCRTVSEALPLFGFYLQPAVGGRPLGHRFWRTLLEAVPRLVAVKIAPFNRYQTLDVVRAVAEAGRLEEVALYTGNDDHILLDLMMPFRFTLDGEARTARIVGGLLGQWAVWTRRAVELFEHVRGVVRTGAAVSPDLLATANRLTDANAAIFDAANDFAGCIPGIHEVLRRQGLLTGTWCLDPGQVLSPGQAEEISRVWKAYPDLRDGGAIVGARGREA